MVLFCLYQITGSGKPLEEYKHSLNPCLYAVGRAEYISGQGQFYVFYPFYKASRLRNLGREAQNCLQLSGMSLPMSMTKIVKYYEFWHCSVIELTLSYFRAFGILVTHEKSAPCKSLSSSMTAMAFGEYSRFILEAHLHFQHKPINTAWDRYRTYWTYINSPPW